MHTKALRRAGLDYHEAATVQVHKDLTHCLELLAAATVPGRVYAATTKGSMPYSDINYQLNDVLLFGPETQGLPDEVLQDERVCKKIRIPMLPDSRSLNLSNAVAIVAYEALRQQGHPGLD